MILLTKEPALNFQPYLNRFAGGWIVLSVILIQKAAQRRSDLVLVDGFPVLPFAAQRAIGADKSHPDVLRFGNFLSVIGPIPRRCAAPVIHGYDDRGLPFIPPVRLQVFPQLAQITVGAPQRFKRLVVAPVV